MNCVPSRGPSGLPCSTARAAATSPDACAPISSTGAFRSAIASDAPRSRSPPTLPVPTSARSDALRNSIVPAASASGANPSK